MIFYFDLQTRYESSNDSVGPEGDERYWLPGTVQGIIFFFCKVTPKYSNTLSLASIYLYANTNTNACVRLIEYLGYGILVTFIIH